MAEGTAAGGIESRWEALLRITRSWRLEWNAAELLGRVCREAVELLGAEQGLVFVLENENLSVRSACPAGEPAAETLEAAREAAEGVTRSGRAIFAHQLEGDAGRTGGAIYCVPLTSSRGILGALYARGGARAGGQKQDEELFELLGLQAASALEHLSLYQSAIRDPLTRLFSHRYFQEQVDQQIRQARRSARPVSMLVMDLDNFKELNDTAGHKAGNQYLVGVADELRAALRDSDVIARFGGDEFEVLLPETEAAGARLVAEKLRGLLDALKTPGEIEVTVSLGVASFPVNALDAETLFLRADAALYEAKGAGRDRVAVCSREEKPATDPSAERGRGSSRTREHEALADTPELESGRAAPRTPDGPAFEAPAQEQVDGHPVIDRLGTGSSGEVLLVEQAELNREVALKRPHTANLTREQAAAFEREALTTAALSHPGVVPIYTMGTDADGRRYYTMKPLRDLSLGEILEQRRTGDAEVLRKYTQSRLLDIVHSVSETIAYAHRSRIAHLDLNPRNILVGEFGEVVVIDWGGFAAPSSGKKRNKRSKTSTLLLPGSPQYAAPEQLSGKPLGLPSDVHSLGAMLYEVLTGRSPYLRADTRSTLQALREGQVAPPDVAAPERGVDPTLSALCMAALRRDPRERISAAEFSERLGRCVRREREWEVIRFGEGGREVSVRDWTTLQGDWSVSEGEIAAAGGGDQVILWRVPVPGSFRFICEGWVESPAELSLIGHGASAAGDAVHSSPRGINPTCEGYCFEFGAEHQSCAKLARHGHDVLGRPGLVPRPGRRYRLEMAYEDGWLFCFVDGERIFSYRELFPLSGSSVGFYAYGRGAHFRPLEIHRQNWGLQPAMRMADDLYRHGFSQAAVDRYLLVADQNPDRLEGDEARLKIGICLAEQGKTEEARKVFASVRGGPLEPFAMSEEAMLYFRRGSRDPEPGLRILREMVERFPESQAQAHVLEAANRARRSTWGIVFADDLETDLRLRAEIMELGASAAQGALKSNLVCAASLMSYRFLLGEWRRALEQGLEYWTRIPPEKRRMPVLQSSLWPAAMAVGEEDRLPDEPIPDDVTTHSFGAVTPWATGFRLHWAVRKGAPGTYLAGVLERYGGQETALSRNLAEPEVIQAMLAAGRAEDLAAALSRVLESPGEGPLSRRRLSWNAYSWAVPLFDAGRDDLREAGGRALEIWRNMHESPAPREDLDRVRRMCEARGALVDGDLAAAAAALEGETPPPFFFSFGDGLALQAMLSSLGELGSPGRGELEVSVEKFLAGAPRELARGFLRGELPDMEGGVWPVPTFIPEWRLWPALWLERRGESERALGVARPALDARYGLANCQVPLGKLVERLEK